MCTDDDVPQLVQKGRSNIVDGHLKGAMSIMSSNTEAPDPAAVFLERVCYTLPQPSNLPKYW